MDGRKILEVYDAGGKMQKAMHKNEVIWEPDRRIPATVFFQEVDTSESFAIAEEAVRKCLESTKFKIAYIDGYKSGNDAIRLSQASGKIFKSRPSNEIYICAMTSLGLCLYSCVGAKNNNMLPYHIFEDEIKQEIEPDLYVRYIQPAKDKLGEKYVNNITNWYKTQRNAMGETS